MSTGYTDFDAWLSEQEPVYGFRFDGHDYVVPEIDMRAFAALATMHETIESTSPVEMIDVLRTLVSGQLRPEDRPPWDAHKSIPWRVLTRIAEELTVAAVGRPIGGLSGLGAPSSPTGQPSKTDSSAQVLPPPTFEP